MNEINKSFQTEYIEQIDYFVQFSQMYILFKPTHAHVPGKETHSKWRVYQLVEY